MNNIYDEFKFLIEKVKVIFDLEIKKVREFGKGLYKFIDLLVLFLIKFEEFIIKELRLLRFMFVRFFFVRLRLV